MKTKRRQAPAATPAGRKIAKQSRKPGNVLMPTPAGRKIAKQSWKPGNVLMPTPAGRKIAKQSWKPGNVLMPTPAVLVSCGGTGEWRPNLITIAWTGTVCTDPPMLAISVRPDRHSHSIIGATREFAVNVPSAAEVKALDWCGVVSGRDADKFAATGLTPAPALKLGCPIVAECPLNIECRVRRTMELGSHTLFLAEVVAVQVSSELVDAKNRLRVDQAGLVAFAHGHYFALGRHLGHFGFSVRKRPAVKRNPRT